MGTGWRVAGVAMGAIAAAGYVRKRSRAMDFRGASVVISGGSRGLGLVLAREFGRKGARLTLLARDEAELSRAAVDLRRTGVDVNVQRCDVRKVDEVCAAVQRVLDTRGRVDVLANVAGVIQAAPLEHITTEDFEEAMQVHFWGPLHLTRELVPRMEPGSRIVNISSIGGVVPVPHMLPYVASKFALTGYSEGLRAELSRRKVYVTTICPGLMRTGSHVNARFKGRHPDEFTWFSVAAALPLLSTTPEAAARSIVRACRYATPFKVLTPQARMLHLFHAVAPNLFARLMDASAGLLPPPATVGGGREQPGWQSRSALAPSLLTRLADRAIRRNNELTEEQAALYFGESKR